MAEDLTAKIVKSYDSVELQAGGIVRQTTVVQYMLGRHGPYEHIFDRGPSKYDIEGAINARRATLEGLV